MGLDLPLVHPKLTWLLGMTNTGGWSATSCSISCRQSHALRTGVCGYGEAYTQWRRFLLNMSKNIHSANFSEQNPSLSA
eukprot:6207758-Pleurochrysis_carterae.AAC.5